MSNELSPELKALVTMAAQYLSDGKDVMHHSFMAAGEEAIDVLLANGLVTEGSDGQYRWVDGFDWITHSWSRKP